MAVTPILSTGYKLRVDNAGGSSFATIFATVDFNISQRAPRQETTKQLTVGSAIGIREHKPGLRERSLSFSLRWDAADTQTGETHHELWAAFIEKKKGNWELTNPPTGGTQVVPTYTGARVRTFLAVITGMHIRAPLGNIITADVELTICKAVTESTAA